MSGPLRNGSGLELQVEDGEALKQGVKLVRFVPSVCHLGS